MLLLPELMFRHRFHSPLFSRQGEPCFSLQGRVALGEEESWTRNIEGNGREWYSDH